jgi:hypothetical protein
MHTTRCVTGSELMSISLNKILDKYDSECNNSLVPVDRGTELGKELMLIQVGLGYSLYAIKDKLNLWRRQRLDMSKLYQKLVKLEQELVAAKTPEEKEAIEEEIWELQDEINREESDKYGSHDDEDY